LTGIRARIAAVDIATGYRLDDRGIGVRVPVGSIIFSSSQHPNQLRPTQLPIQLVWGAVYIRVKRPEREANYSSPEKAELKNTWVYISTPIYLIAWCLIS
jgi:hypothetical protein